MPWGGGEVGVISAIEDSHTLTFGVSLRFIYCLTTCVFMGLLEDLFPERFIDLLSCFHGRLFYYFCRFV